MCCIAKQIDHTSIAMILKHFKCLPKTKVSHNVERQVIAPVRHILGSAPLPLLSCLLRSTESGF